jgi:hypothetical protein
MMHVVAVVIHGKRRWCPPDALWAIQEWFLVDESTKKTAALCPPRNKMIFSQRNFKIMSTDSALPSGAGLGSDGHHPLWL